LRRELAFVCAAAAVVVACKADKPYTASFTFTANPLPPVPGQIVAYTFDSQYVGLVEIYQGADLVGEVVNPTDDLDAIYQFVAKSSETPHAIAYGVNGARIEVDATRGAGKAPPVDAGADAVTPPPPPPPPTPESCPGATAVTPDADAGTGCGTYGALLVPVQIRNDRATQLWIYRDQWGAPPTPCTFQPAGVVDTGKTLSLPTLENGVLQFVDSVTKQPFRYVRVVQTASCVLVAK
jgi:hypothetical protein